MVTAEVLEVTEQTRAAVWLLLYDLERNVRYYTAKADHLQRLSYRTRFVLLSSVLIEALLAYPASTYSLGWIALVAVGIFITCLAIWDALSNHARDAAVLKFVALVCDEAKTDTESLWRNIESYRINTDEAEEWYRSIVDRWGRITDKVMLPNDDRVNQECTKAADQVMRSRLAT